MKDGREVAAFTKSPQLRLAILFPHSVAAKFVISLLYPFCSDIQKGYFFMKKRFFPNLTPRDICILGLLMAITTLLSVFCTFRLGTVVKIPLKFISVFLTAFLYGPIYGGLVAAAGDLLNCLLAPSGPIIPQITVIEFLSGFTFGICFLNKNISKNEYIVRTIICAFLQLAIDMIITTAVFSLWLGWYGNFAAGFIVRTPAGVIKLLLHIVVLIAIYPLSLTLNRLNSKEVPTTNDNQQF